MNAGTVNGQLIYIPKSFTYETFIAKSKFVDEKKGWTMRDLLDLAKAHPEAAVFNFGVKDEMLRDCLAFTMEGFIDEKTGVCNFNSEDFKSILEFVAGFPDEYDWNSEYESVLTQAKEDKVLLFHIYEYRIGELQMYHEMLGEDITFIGYPTADGTITHRMVTNGAQFAISSKSEKKDGAWAFIEYYLNEYTGTGSGDVLSTNKKILQKQIDEAMNPEVVKDEKGEVLLDADGNPILNYEGNWRDIFQNWEALAMSYPSYIPNMTAKFLNAMTADGFNPYRISRAGVDWECPEPENPWAQYGYWGDHQVIYLQKFLELWNKTDSESFKKSLNDCLYTSANIPYRLKSYKEILESPHSSITFDKALSDTLINNSKSYGSDAKLVMDGKQPALVSFTAKLLQIVIAKTANLVPGGGIWMNTQRPEWNDANNALAGWGLSVVTLCYLHRMLSFLIDIYSKTEIKSFSLPKALYDCFTALTELYKTTDFKKAIDDDAERKAFTDKAGIIFETERNELYKNGYSAGKVEIQATEIVSSLKAMLAMVMDSIRANKRADGLYHTYNTMIASDSGMKIVRLQEMLEGQVAILSAGLLDSAETLEVLDALKKSPLFESRQESYILYPNKNLPAFTEKNNIPEAKVADLAPLIQRTGNAILEKDCKGFYHFNAEFHNARIMESEVKNLPESVRPNEVELKALHVLYEETFNHQNFTGRSGTFYAYEGLGSIYWHMVSKLLLAVQEHTLEAYENGDKNALALKKAYYDVRRGLSFNKTPELYGAFPSDPYSHTPSGKGAKQPGMTGQVKEEILTRWGELGIGITNGKAHFEPQILNESEFFSSGKDQGKLFFTWCAVPITYTRAKAASIKIGLADGSFTEHIGNELTESETRLLFARDGGIKSITVNVLV